uniref:Maturase n=1 Tax=Erythrotrichia carnea TaxID=35151 RepID=A0A1C9CE45_9RHOD|nr:maturase [Erythrotrichia carnea]AOM66668.1 maturase [Erythrotrichia carnea]
MLKYHTDTIDRLHLESYMKFNDLSWIEVIQSVKMCQKRIYGLSRIGNIVEVRNIQKKLFINKKACLLAIRCVLNRNVQYQLRLKKTNSDFLFVDPHILSCTTHINRFIDENQKVIVNLVIHELVLIILRPEWEARLEPNCYGFSASLAIKQAIIKAYSILTQNQIYKNSTVLVGNLNNWIPKLETSFILKKSNYTGTLKKYLSSVCTRSLFSSSSSLINKKFQFIDITGFPYNSIALLFANIVFYGLEMSVAWQTNSNQCNCKEDNIRHIRTIVCSDHFLIIFPDTNINDITVVINVIRSFFASLGLILQDSSLSVESIHDGFDFLGFNFKRHRNKEAWNNEKTKLILKPTSNNIKKHLLSMRYCLYHKDRLNRWRANAQMTQYDVINQLNPIIKEFTTYYQDLIPSSVLKTLDRTLNEFIYRYAIKKYKSNRSQKWNNNWTTIVNGKKVIAYKNETKVGYQLLFLHYNKATYLS